jgi:hypothetical protein
VRRTERKKERKKERERERVREIDRERERERELALLIYFSYIFAGLHVFTAGLLMNCHCCLYGNQISQYYNCAPPVLDDYLA